MLGGYFGKSERHIPSIDGFQKVKANIPKVTIDESKTKDLSDQSQSKTEVDQDYKSNSRQTLISKMDSGERSAAPDLADTSKKHSIYGSEAKSALASSAEFLERSQPQRVSKLTDSEKNELIREYRVKLEFMKEERKDAEREAAESRREVRKLKKQIEIREEKFKHEMELLRMEYDKLKSQISSKGPDHDNTETTKNSTESLSKMWSEIESLTDTLKNLLPSPLTNASAETPNLELDIRKSLEPSGGPIVNGTQNQETGIIMSTQSIAHNKQESDLKEPNRNMNDNEDLEPSSPKDVLGVHDIDHDKQTEKDQTNANEGEWKQSLMSIMDKF